MSFICSPSPPSESPLRPCWQELDDEDRQAAFSLKRKLLRSVVDAVRGKRLVQARHIWAGTDVQVNAFKTILPELRSRLEAKLRMLDRRLRGQRAIVIGVRNSEGVICELAAMLGNLSVKTVLVTPGHADTGAPFRTASRFCARRILQMPTTLRWFVTHHSARDPSYAKISWLPVGFGLAYSTAIRLSAKALQMRVADEEDATAATMFPLLADAAQALGAVSPQSRRALDRSLEYLFVCNNDLEALGRRAILDALNASMPGYVNNFPASPRRYFCGALRAVTALSPRGTAPDGYRHLEYLLAGAAVILPDHPCMRDLYQNLPVIFAEPPVVTGPPITCSMLKRHVREFGAPERRFEHTRLTAEFWIQELRRAAAAPAPAGTN